MKRMQSGVALISVLLVFSLVAVIASQMLASNYLSIRKTANRIDSRQAYYYALAGEQLARQVLARDFIAGSSESDVVVDHFDDDWAQNLDQFDIDQGRMQVEIIDAQSLFNLSSLVDKDGVAIAKNIQQFRRLLDLLDISAEISDSLTDWQDTDSTALTAGGEDAYYQFLERPYLSANQRLIDSSELRLLKGVSYDDYRALKPFVVALPEITTYNINTAKAELLRALSATINESSADNIAGIQQDGGHSTVSQWLSEPSANDLSGVADQLSVGSEYFQIRVVSEFNRRNSRLTTLIKRDAGNGKITVISRQSDQHLKFKDSREL